MNIKNIKSMNFDEKKIMKSINNQETTETTDHNNFDNSDLNIFDMQQRENKKHLLVMSLAFPLQPTLQRIDFKTSSLEKFEYKKNK